MTSPEMDFITPGSWEPQDSQSESTRALQENITAHTSITSWVLDSLSECQAAFNTWISRSLPHAHLLLHTPLISVPLQREKELHSCKLSQDFSYSITRCWATVTESRQCFTTSNNPPILRLGG
ncbi:unnamed protein product [Pleuronectes platessa]|uniref:Uncharacterized protein n=1 Tax=Pleuronectes platessa TaxID=8262 RepID=A0A9N7V123_PLEPL|nr:unnamed protein product [Pleuronectes platessa]